MRAPWTALAAAQADLRRERDERAELIALRRERIVLRTVVAVGYVGLILIIGRSGDSPRTTWASLGLLLVALLAGGVAAVVARKRHGRANSPEARLADATRSLYLLPVTVPVVALIYWYVGQDLIGTLVWTATSGTMMTAALLLRRGRLAREVQREIDDEGPATVSGDRALDSRTDAPLPPRSDTPELS